MQNNKFHSLYPFDFGSYTLPISENEEVQFWFDKALQQAYNFNHEETILCCDEAIKIDPKNPLLYFLKAIAYGINYNNAPPTLEVDQAQNQYDNWVLADQNKQNTSEYGKKIIEALKYKVADGKTLTHDIQDKQYAEALGKVYEEYVSNEENLKNVNFFTFLSELYAESLMNLRPWDLWSQKPENYGQPYENTLKIQQVIQLGLKHLDSHTGLRHLWIHCEELSKFPENALCSNFPERLRDITKSSGHLCHMPSHVEILCGQYDQAMISNQIAIKADNDYFEYRKKKGMEEVCFFILYRCHNIHFLAFAAMFAGRWKESWDAGQQIIQVLSKTVLENKSYFAPLTGADWLESFIQISIHILIRFGKWEQLISENPLETLSLEEINNNKELYASTLTMIYYGRGIAYAVLAGSKQDKKEEYIKLSEQNHKLFLEQKEKVPETRTLFNNSMQDIFQIADNMLLGELHYRKEEYLKAFEYLRKAVEKDDGLPYDEPWGWMVPSRHALGALLLEQGTLSNNKEMLLEAEQTYKKDLGEGIARAVSHPDNIWSLIGLTQCYKQLGKEEEKNLLKPKLDKALQFADITIKASCLCSIKQF